jgi:HAD superfamily hydrolase (TIGR01509 family)
MNENVGLPAAILWDMDGTLIDTEPHWIESEIQLCAEHGVTWTHEDGLGLVGNPLSISSQALQARGVNLSIDEIIDYLLVFVEARVREHMPWNPDARRLLDWAIAQDIPCALVTMSYRFLAKALTDAEPHFSLIVAGEDVTNGKPHPEPYLMAAERLGVPIERCLAIEDSPSGIRSAAASGARAVGVRRITPLDPIPGLSRVRSLDSLTPDGIARVMAGEVLDELGDET